MKWLLWFCRNTFNWILGRPKLYKAIKVEDLPDELRHNVLYVAGENEHLWYAAMLCPCGCGEILRMGLMQDQRPRWSINEHVDGTISLKPSVWRQVGCRSHFWLKRGNICWCKSECIIP